MKAPARSNEVELGYVSGVFGVRGELRLFLHNRDSDLLSEGPEVTLVSPEGERRVVRLQARPGSGGRVIGQIADVRSPEAARRLKDWRIRIASTLLPAPEPDEFYVHAVVGLAVRVDGAVVGEVVEVHSTGPCDVLEVQLEAGGRGFVPALRSHGVEVDLDGGVVEVAPGALAEAQ